MKQSTFTEYFICLDAVVVGWERSVQYNCWSSHLVIIHNHLYKTLLENSEVAS